MKVLRISPTAFLQSEYETDSPRFQSLCLEIVKQVDELLKSEHINLASPIEWRLKTWPSIVDKLQRNQIEPKSLAELRDIAGVRVIALFRRDLEPIQRIIEDNLTILNKEDTFTRLDENQFGYGSIHYEVQPPEHWLKIPTLRKLSGLRAEIQVRTGSQHIWAAASHLLQYKKEAHVPPPLRRTINRVAALLETVDLEFERVLAEREQYSLEISKDNEDLPLNTESLRRLLDATLPEKNRTEEGADPYADLLDELFHFNIRTTKHLESIIKKHLEAVLRDEKIQLQMKLAEIKSGKEPRGTSKERVDRGVFFTHVGLTRGVLSLEFPNEFQAYLLHKATSMKPTSS